MSPARNSKKLSLRTALVAAWVALLLVSTTSQAGVLANGGTPVFAGDSGPFNVVAVMSPTPPIPTVPTHIDVILTKKSSEQPVTTATVLVEPEMPGMAMPGVSSQRFTQTINRPNQYFVDMPLTMEGQWRFKITIVDSQLGSTTFTVNTKVEKPDAPWPIIIAILVALPVLAGLTWYFLFRNQASEDDEDEEEGSDEDDRGKGPKEVKVGT